LHEETRKGEKNKKKDDQGVFCQIGTPTKRAKFREYVPEQLKETEKLKNPTVSLSRETPAPPTNPNPYRCSAE